MVASPKPQTKFGFLSTNPMRTDQHSIIHPWPSGTQSDPQNIKKHPPENGVSLSVFFSDYMGWWQAPNLKLGSVFCQLTPWRVRTDQNFRAPIRPPKHQKNTPQKTAFPYQYFLSVTKRWWRAQTSNQVWFSVNSTSEDQLTLNQPSPNFTTPIRPPKHQNNTYLPVCLFASIYLPVESICLPVYLSVFVCLCLSLSLSLFLCLSWWWWWCFNLDASVQYKLLQVFSLFLLVCTVAAEESCHRSCPEIYAPVS